MPKEGKQLEVFIEPDNLKDKFAVCFKVNKTNIRHVEKRSYGKICKKSFFLWYELHSNSSMLITEKKV